MLKKNNIPVYFSYKRGNLTEKWTLDKHKPAFGELGTNKKGRAKPARPVQ